MYRTLRCFIRYTPELQLQYRTKNYKLAVLKLRENQVRQINLKNGCVNGPKCIQTDTKEMSLVCSGYGMGSPWTPPRHIELRPNVDPDQTHKTKTQREPSPDTLCSDSTWTQPRQIGSTKCWHIGSNVNSIHRYIGPRTNVYKALSNCGLTTSNLIQTQTYSWHFVSTLNSLQAHWVQSHFGHISQTRLRFTVDTLGLDLNPT